MKVLICVGSRERKSYLLYFKKGNSKKRIRQILSHEDSYVALHKVMAIAEKAVEVSPRHLKRVGTLVDFTISQRGYVAERLA